MPTVEYDSTGDTREHRAQVFRSIQEITDELTRRACRHDLSKLDEPEKAIFDEFTPRLRNTTYGSEEYQRALRDMEPALKHHYAVNDHHPEHHPHGIRSMDMVQLLEMLADWHAATKRHADGDLRRSILQNCKRFGMSVEMTALLTRTAERRGWI